MICGDDPIGAELSRRHGGVTYGLGVECDVRAVDVRATSGSFRFGLTRRGLDGSVEHLGDVALPLRGVHNVVNATGAAAMALEVGVAFDDIAAALARFGGVARRFDVRGIDGGATLVDDYAHLPSEIDAVIRAARDSGDSWQRVVAVFQPNRYHRIQEMWQEYALAFTAADLVVLTDIFGATPSRIAARLAEPHRVTVLAGVNLPMLVKALNNRRVPVADLVQALVSSAKAAILEVEPPADEGERRAPG